MKAEAAAAIIIAESGDDTAVKMKALEMVNPFVQLAFFKIMSNIKKKKEAKDVEQRDYTDDEKGEIIAGFQKMLETVDTMMDEYAFLPTAEQKLYFMEMFQKHGK